MLQTDRKVFIKHEYIWTIVSPENVEKTIEEYARFSEPIAKSNIKDITEIVSPDEDLNTQISKILTLCHGFYDITDIKDTGRVTIHIEHGDWKHDHAFINHVMTMAFNAKFVSESITEPSNSDCYSSDHVYDIPI